MTIEKVTMELNRVVLPTVYKDNQGNYYAKDGNGVVYRVETIEDLVSLINN